MENLDLKPSIEAAENSTSGSQGKLRLGENILNNPVLQRAFLKLKASQEDGSNHSGFKNHGSHNTHNRGPW